jgi:hypothetical protein
MKISNKKLFIDFKDFSSESHYFALNYEDMVDDFWKKFIFENHGFPFSVLTPILPNCQKISNYKLLNLFNYHRKKEIESFCRG